MGEKIFKEFIAAFVFQSQCIEVGACMGGGRWGERERELTFELIAPLGHPTTATSTTSTPQLPPAPALPVVHDDGLHHHHHHRHHHVEKKHRIFK